MNPGFDQLGLRFEIHYLQGVKLAFIARFKHSTSQALKGLNQNLQANFANP
jgi:hypothetical protein